MIILPSVGCPLRHIVLDCAMIAPPHLSHFDSFFISLVVKDFLVFLINSSSVNSCYFVVPIKGGKLSAFLLHYLGSNWLVPQFLCLMTHFLHVSQGITLDYLPGSTRQTGLCSCVTQDC